MQPLLLLPLLALPALAQSTDGKSTAKAGIENTPVVFANLTNLDSALKITAECATKCYKDKFIGYNNAYDAGRCPITGDKKEVVDWYCTCEAWHADKTTRNPSAYKIVDERFENCMTTSNLQCGKTEAILSESSNALNDYKKLVTDGFMDFCVKKFPALKVNETVPKTTAPKESSAGSLKAQSVGMVVTAVAFAGLGAISFML